MNTGESHRRMATRGSRYRGVSKESSRRISEPSGLGESYPTPVETISKGSFAPSFNPSTARLHASVTLLTERHLAHVYRMCRPVADGYTTAFRSSHSTDLRGAI